MFLYHMVINDREGQIGISSQATAFRNFICFLIFWRNLDLSLLKNMIAFSKLLTTPPWLTVCLIKFVKIFDRNSWFENVLNFSTGTRGLHRLLRSLTVTHGFLKLLTFLTVTRGCLTLLRSPTETHGFLNLLRSPTVTDGLLHLLRSWTMSHGLLNLIISPTVTRVLWLTVFLLAG